MPRKPSFTIDEEGAIRLLRKDIYGRSDVFLRELIQNALDSGASNINLYLLSKDSENVWSILCHDNGKGMSKDDIQNYFLRLCKRYPDNDLPRYARYGIGVFTYLAFANNIKIVTKASRGKGWLIDITVPKIISSLDEVHISDYTRIAECTEGTSVFLNFSKIKSIDEVLDSLSFYLRYTLPAKLTVNITKELRIELNNYSEFLNKLKSESYQLNLTEKRSVPPNAIRIIESGPVNGGYLYFKPEYQNQIAICEDGILVDDSCQDLMPSKYQNLGIQGLLNIKRGWLDIDAARLKVQRTEKFSFLADFAERLVLSAVIKHFSLNEIKVDDIWSSNAKLLYKILTKLSAKKGAEILYKSAKKIYVKIFSHYRFSATYSTLMDIAIKARPYGQIFYVDGLNWGWKKNAGSLKGYDIEIFVRQSDYAKIAYSKGATVLEMPKRTEEGLLIPNDTLKQFFLEYFSIILHDITHVSQGKPSGLPLPYKWHSYLELPSNVSNSNLPGNSELFLDSQLRAVIDINKGTFRHIDEILSNKKSLSYLEKGLIEAYLHLATADITSALKKIEQIINSITSQKDKHTTFTSLIEEIRNGRKNLESI